VICVDDAKLIESVGKRNNKLRQASLKTGSE
jgi:hypothetical protein